MIKAQKPADEKKRLEVLRGYDILDTEIEESFNDIVEIAALICDTPIALVCLVDAERQWFKARLGIQASETHRDIAFCAHAILEREVFRVVDALNDVRFADNPLVTSDPKIRAYAGAPLITKDGFALGTLCVIDTVPKTLSAHQEQMLQKLAKQVVFLLELRIEQKTAVDENLAKSSFLSKMSHELRTPLNSILGFGQLLQTDPEVTLTESQNENVDMILKGGNHLLKLINEILELAKIEAGEVECSFSHLNSADIIHDCVPMLKVLAKAKKIEVNLEILNNYTIIADEIKLKQILINLLNNAIKYSPSNNTITISSLIVEDEFLKINIQDNGIGIPANQQQEIFSPFYRVDQEHSDIEGTGIGLTVAREMIELMNGRIGVESITGEGSTFWIELPLIKNE
jgi:signal transduction histidine kinase